MSNLSSAEIAKAKRGLHADYPLGIAQCGADALRFTLCSYNYSGILMFLFHYKVLVLSHECWIEEL